MKSQVLSLRGVTAEYGGLRALFGVDMDIFPGSTVALIGRNGAGKSTTFRAIMGVEVARRGQIEFNGRDIVSEPTFRIARQGIAWVPPDRRILTNLTVRENLSLVQSSRRTSSQLEQVLDALPFVKPLLDRRGNEMSGGEQQAVAVARGLMAAPKVLLLDEPSEGLAPMIVDQMGAALRDLPSRFGVTVVIAEQNLEFALNLSDSVHVMESGKIVHTSTAREFSRSPELQERYLSVSATRS